ncbi:MAG TPA: methyltransferase domain-containing protein [Capsulimonadaceae bacterium]|nr:methyltransferase domain-containing protein [Capsulimonadaceae bacterium]
MSDQTRNPKEIVCAGYDQISEEYRRDDFVFEGTGYQRFLTEFERYLKPGSRILDLGCGCGIPVARHLAQAHSVTGVDISQVQIDRAKGLVPAANFLQADMTELSFPDSSFDAVVSFFAIIHIPLAEQPALFEKIARWLVPGGHFLATLGSNEWTGTRQDWHGGTMYWSHANRHTYEEWLQVAGFAILAERFLPEGDSGHAVFMAQKA